MQSQKLNIKSKVVRLNFNHRNVGESLEASWELAYKLEQEMKEGDLTLDVASNNKTN